MRLRDPLATAPVREVELADSQELRLEIWDEDEGRVASIVVRGLPSSSHSEVPSQPLR